MKPTRKSSAAATTPELEHKDLLSGFVRLHILHHADKEGVYGQWMIEELARHGYRVSAGTIYPMLHTMERRGYLGSSTERLCRTHRRLYRATALGREALAAAESKLRELFRELVEGDGQAGPNRNR
jgi:DNA-binding PadR family transcriptional regulator